jgi:hypothetical protein
VATEIKLAEGATVTVVEEYRDVYAKLLAANWQLPCEFVDTGDEHHQITINPAFLVYFRAA